MSDSQLNILILVVQAVAMSILVAVTVWYAKETRRQAKASELAVNEMRQTREAQARAYVTVELWPWDRDMNDFDFAIRNYGSGAARDVSITFDPDVPDPRYGEGTLNQLDVFRGLPFLAPNDVFLFYFGKRRHIRDSSRTPPVPEVLRGEASFTDDIGRHEISFKINLKEFDRLASTAAYGEQPGAPPIRLNWGRTRAKERATPVQWDGY